MNKNLLELTSNIYIKYALVLLMINNPVLGASILLSAALAISVLAKADFGAPALAQGVTADIVKGTTKPEDVISYTTGISAENGKVLNPKTEAGVTKELDRDIATTSSTEDVSKLVGSGTSSAKSGGIDKDDIYSSDDSTRHLEKVQDQETTTDKEATNTES